MLAYLLVDPFVGAVRDLIGDTAEHRRADPRLRALPGHRPTNRSRRGAARAGRVARDRSSLEARRRIRGGREDLRLRSRRALHRLHDTVPRHRAPEPVAVAAQHPVPAAFDSSVDARGPHHADDRALRLGAIGIAFIAGQCKGTAAWLLGVPLRSPRIVARAPRADPQVGATIAAVGLSLVALTQGVPQALVMLTVCIAYQQLENYVLQPTIQGPRGRYLGLLRDRQRDRRGGAPRRRRSPHRGPARRLGADRDPRAHRRAAGGGRARTRRGAGPDRRRLIDLRGGAAARTRRVARRRAARARTRAGSPRRPAARASSPATRPRSRRRRGGDGVLPRAERSNRAIRPPTSTRCARRRSTSVSSGRRSRPRPRPRRRRCPRDLLRRAAVRRVEVLDDRPSCAAAAARPARAAPRVPGRHAHAPGRPIPNSAAPAARAIANRSLVRPVALMLAAAGCGGRRRGRLRHRRRVLPPRLRGRRGWALPAGVDPDAARCGARPRAQRATSSESATQGSSSTSAAASTALEQALEERDGLARRSPG